ncbi:MAG: Malate permease [uncultured Sulfurovum sp.]|uniref:Malate permease n=1 Tax=uncultured Sulfurovum sp. TaxID=269237 RepID=A0A6S6SP59_9BACT|nr:MAG: Malate permease [uncultured Sulfurovum sp.]
MFETLLSIMFVYVFIFLGYLAKRIFKDEMDSKTLTLFSVYFLQAFVTVWGFSTAKLSTEHLSVPLYYILITLILLLPTIFISKYLIKDPKERSIVSIAGFVGNTGNIGIPLGIALFGMESVIYTTLINLANVFVVYVFGVYIYSRGSFSIQKSLFNIIKIPIIPASVLAILINISDIHIAPQINEFLKMGAYAGIVLQLFLLGTFLYGIKLSTIKKSIIIIVMSQKFIIIPIATAFILSYTDLSLFVQAIIIMEMTVPLAIANINLASLYNCRPEAVSTLILISMLIFVPMLFILSKVLSSFYL